MEVIKFEKLTFKEIPERFNPAYGTKKCVMICKLEQQKPPYTNKGKFCVLKIDPVNQPNEEESVSHLGLFWEIKHAELFATVFIKDEKVLLDFVHTMCVESLDPESFYDWEKIVKLLKKTRKFFK